MQILFMTVFNYIIYSGIMNIYYAYNIFCTFIFWKTCSTMNQVFLIYFRAYTILRSLVNQYTLLYYVILNIDFKPKTNILIL